MGFSAETRLKWMAQRDRRAMHEMFRRCREENGGKLWFQSGVDSEENYWSSIRFFGSLTLAVVLILIFAFGAHAQIIQPASKGTASYYTHASTIKEGNLGIMANGKKMKDNAMTCASWFYPFGTVLTVRNLDNGKIVQVVVTDRGPSKRLVKKGRIIDLSAGSFKKLASLKQGIIKVAVSK